MPSPQERLRHAFSSESPRRDGPSRPAHGPVSFEQRAPASRRRQASPSIRVVGVGGAGVNAVNRMVEAGLSGIEPWR